VELRPLAERLPRLPLELPVEGRVLPRFDAPVLGRDPVPALGREPVLGLEPVLGRVPALGRDSPPGRPPAELPGLRD
jgi:hypothetical protein